MHPQLEEIVDDFERARTRLHALASTLTPEMWTRRSAPERWSPAECVAHLNLTADAFRPFVVDGLQRARTVGRSAPPRYRRDPLGWFLWTIMPPPYRMKVKTSPAFVPGSTGPPEDLVGTFDRLQDEQVDWVRAADGLPISQVKVRSPFSARATYNLFACLGILPRHQHRHLWQAEQAARGRG